MTDELSPREEQIMRIISVADAVRLKTFESFIMSLADKPLIFGTSHEFTLDWSVEEAVKHLADEEPYEVALAILSLLNRVDDECVWEVRYRRNPPDVQYHLTCTKDGISRSKSTFKVVTPREIYTAITSLVLRMEKAGVTFSGSLADIGVSSAKVRGWTALHFDALEEK